MTRRLAILLTTLFALSAALFPIHEALATCLTGALKPALQASAVSQGVGTSSLSGSGENLVRGKDTMVRFFLARPACAVKGDTLNVTAASTLAVTETGGGNPLTNGSGSPSLIEPTAAIAVHATYANNTTPPDANYGGDAIFAVPGSMLTPTSGTPPTPYTGSFTATFTGTINYSANGSPGSTSFTATATISQLSNALRILVVPMGDGTQPYSTYFTSGDNQTLQNGMATMAR